MRKNLLAKAHITKLKELTASEVTELTSSTVDVTALAILMRQGSREITIVVRRGRSDLTSMLIHIDRNDRQNVPNWQRRTLNLPNFTKKDGIATSC